jgi:hypothetical protein
MRYELDDFEWVAIKPRLPNNPRVRVLAHSCGTHSYSHWATGQT